MSANCFVFHRVWACHVPTPQQEPYYAQWQIRSLSILMLCAIMVIQIKPLLKAKSKQTLKQNIPYILLLRSAYISFVPSHIWNILWFQISHTALSLLNTYHTSWFFKMISPYINSSQCIITMHTFSYCTQTWSFDVIACDYQPERKNNQTDDEIRAMSDESLTHLTTVLRTT